MPAGKTTKKSANNDGGGGGGGTGTTKVAKKVAKNDDTNVKANASANNTNNSNDNNDNNSSGKANITNPNNPAHRTTFRPPWVKEGQNSTTVAPWTLNKRGSRDITEDGPIGIQLRKTSLKSTPQTHENGTTTTKDNTFVLPQLRPVPPKEVKEKEVVKVPINLKKVEDRPRESIAPVVTEPRRDSLKFTANEELAEIDKACPATRNDIVRQESMKKLNIPKAPPMPPPAPALPKLIESKLNDEQQKKLDALRARPKTRPDWSALLKNIESGKKLKHVETNDRSNPLLPIEKAKGQFLYESEKEKLDSAHNLLLKQIQQGIHLKRVKTNDRSKPMLEGLRKFRRQMTIEEQIQKSVSMASIPPEEIADEADEMDDIDKVRDDLQSTKQMLALELRSKEAQIRENKKLLLKLQNLEAELEKERSNKKESSTGNNSADEKIIKSLKTEAEQAKKMAEDLEKKYTTTAEELDKSKTEVEDLKRQKQEMERRLQEALSGKRMSMSGRQGSIMKSESEEEVFSEISESDDDGEETEEKRERRAQRELKMLRNKLRSFKNKEDNAKKERAALKDLMKKAQTAMKEEKKKFKQLQKEVDKISAMMKDSSDEEEEEEEDEEDEDVKEESETETESSETETESETESESEKSVSEDEDAPHEKQTDNLNKRVKRHENILGALKKGNFMLKTNVERLQDDLNKQKEMTAALQDDLNSVLAELG